MRKGRLLAAAAMIAITPPAILAGKKVFLPESGISTSDKNFTTSERERLPKNSIDISQNVISEKELNAYREDAIKSLIGGLPESKVVDHLRDPERLRAESEAYVPSHAERDDVFGKAKDKFKELATAMAPGEYGLFGFADIDKTGEEYHRLYVMHKEAGTEVVKFVQAFRISMAEKGFSTKDIEGYTPLGLQYFTHSHEGYYGEVVDVLPKKLPYFKRTVGSHHFVSEFEKESTAEPAVVVTDRYTISARRGIHFHGSNRTGRWHLRNGKKVWVSSLRGARSGACGRMGHADVRVLGRKYIKLPVMKDGKFIYKGTPIMIHATPAVMKRKPPVAEKEERTQESATESPPKNSRSGNSGSSGTRPDPFASNN